MTPELSKTLAELASKLGVGVESLWPVLVAHARTEAITGIAVGAFCFFLGTKVISGPLKSARAASDYDSDIRAFAWNGAVAVLFLLGTVFIALGIPDAIYPQAAAIHQLIGR